MSSPVPSSSASVPSGRPSRLRVVAIAVAAAVTLAAASLWLRRRHTAASSEAAHKSISRMLSKSGSKSGKDASPRNASHKPAALNSAVAEGDEEPINPPVGPNGELDSRYESHCWADLTDLRISFMEWGRPWFPEEQQA